jgi:hypothetical protein
VDKDNDVTPIEQRDAPGGETPQEAQRSWVSILASEAHHVGDTLLDAAALYGPKQGWDKFRKPPPPPPPPSGSASDSEA